MRDSLLSPAQYRIAARVVADHHGVATSAITSRTRRAEHVRARHHLWVLLVDDLGFSRFSVARSAGYDRTSVQYALDAWDQAHDAVLVERIRGALAPAEDVHAHMRKLELALDQAQRALTALRQAGYGLMEYDPTELEQQ